MSLAAWFSLMICLPSSSERVKFWMMEVTLLPPEMPEAEKATRADYSFVNDGSFEQLDAFVKGVIDAVAPASVECGAD